MSSAFLLFSRKFNNQCMGNRGSGHNYVLVLMNNETALFLYPLHLNTVSVTPSVEGVSRYRIIRL